MYSSINKLNSNALFFLILDGNGYADARYGRNAGHARSAAHGPWHRGPRPGERPQPLHARPTQPAHVAAVSTAAAAATTTTTTTTAAATTTTVAHRSANPQLADELGAAFATHGAAVAAQYGAAVAAHGALAYVAGAHVTASQHVATSKYVAASQPKPSFH